jgi:hypothetical protein
MMIESTKREEVTAALDLFDRGQSAKEESISCDMSAAYLKVCE